MPVFFITYTLLSKSANCYDNLQNSEEEGVDCNGSCQLRCDGTYRDIRIDFARGMKVTEGMYDIFVLLENYNTNINFPYVPYGLSFYSVEGKLLGTTTGTLSLLPQRKAALYLPSLKLSQEPKTIDVKLAEHKAMSFYDFDSIPKSISVDNWQSQRGANNSLQVVGEIKNPNNIEARNLSVYAMLFDDTRTVYAVSKTKVFSIKGREKTAVTFTWGQIADPKNVEFIVEFDDL